MRDCLASGALCAIWKNIIVNPVIVRPRINPGHGYQIGKIKAHPVWRNLRGVVVIPLSRSGLRKLTWCCSDTLVMIRFEETYVVL